MMNKKLMPMVLSIVMLISIPVISVNASTATVTALPSLNMSKLVIDDFVNATFTYPSNSYISQELSGTSYSLKISNINVPQDSEAFQSFENALQNQDPSITLVNMSVSMSKTINSNNTALVINRNVIITAWVSGTFNRTSNKLTVNFGWKNFDVKNEIDVEDQGINFVGSNFFLFGPLNNKMMFLGFLNSIPLKQESTLNFSAFNTPLSQWARSYNPSDNMTSFSKAIQSTSIYSASLSINGQNYSIKIVSDPAFTINVPGYAVASGNNITIMQSPPTSVQYIAAIAVVIVIASIISIIYLKKK
jgi:hypothetical protein